MIQTTSNVVRTYAGRPIPAPGTYEIDPDHTSVEFVARNLMITRVRGRFTGVSGTLTVGERPEQSHVEVVLNAATITTGNSKRDAHLRSADFFDVERFPTIWFRSSSVGVGTAGRWTLTGDLTIRDTTRVIRFDTAFEGAARSSDGRDRIGFSARTELNRYDWGVTYNTPVDNGGVLIGRQVQIELEVQAVV